MLHDLVGRFPAAASRREVDRLDFGTPEARAHLLRGWGPDEHGDGETFVWGLGDESELELFVASPVRVALGLRCHPLAYPGAAPQIVRVEVNGRPAGKIDAGREFGDHRLEIAADLLRPGPNRVLFRYGDARVPAEVLPGSGDPRRLAVQWYSLELSGLGSEAEPSLGRSDDGAGDEDRLELPAGTGVSYYLNARPGSQLVIGELTGARSSRGIRLAVTWQTDQGAVSRVLDPRTAELPARLDFPETGSGLVRMTLSAGCAPETPDCRSGGWGRLWGRALPPGLSLLLPMVMAPEDEMVFESRSQDGPRREDVTRPPILIYMIDTLRADHLGIYGYERPTSPEIDRFARDAVVFSHAQAQSSWTRTSVASLFTGLLPWAHGVNGRDDALAGSIETLAETLQAAGYETAGFVTNGNVAASFGLGQGFDQYRYLSESKGRPEVHVLSRQLGRQVGRWLEERNRDRGEHPLFLYVHATDPHAPYTPPEPFRRRFAAGVDARHGALANVREITLGNREAPSGTREAWIDLYDGEIASNDRELGRWLDLLRDLGLYDSALILVLSDHGEEFLEHGGWQHGRTLYGEQLRVPFLLKLPGNAHAGTRVDAPVAHVDLVPTLLDLLGLEVPPYLDGDSLLPLLEGWAWRRPAFAYLGLEQRDVRSVLAGGFKLIADRSGAGQASLELFEVGAGGSEISVPGASRPLELGFLEQSLRGLELDLRRKTRRFDPDRAEVSDELRERLKALGYVD